VELKEGLEEIKLNMQYPKDFINQIITGDCLEVMKGIPDNSIDLVLTDPPYNIAADITVIIDTRIHGNKNRKILSNLANSEWDKMNKMEYIEKMKIFFIQCKRVLKPSGILCCFTADRYLSYFRDIINSLDMIYRQTCFWIKSNPPLQMRKVHFQNAVELFFFANKEKGHDSFRWENGQHHNTFYHPSVGGHEKTIHPTQKPIWLSKKLIEYFTNKNDLVLDPFLGSGTIAAACVELGRNFIGIEVNPEYVEIAKKRVAEAKRQEDLF